MKMNRTLPLAGALAMFAAMAGCSQESNPGGPGVTNAPRSTTTTTTPSAAPNVTRPGDEVATTRETHKPVVTDKADTFTVKAPNMTTTLDTGKKKDIDISISRGSDFKQSIKLEFKPPAGVTVTPAMATIPAGQDKVTVTLEASNGALAGKTQVEVTAVPETGKSSSLQIPVEVKHAS
jgi:uncharacterized membrane protein